MNSSTTLSKYRQKNASASNPMEDTLNTDFTQVASCAVGVKDKGKHPNLVERIKLLRDQIKGADEKPLKKKFLNLF